MTASGSIVRAESIVCAAVRWQCIQGLCELRMMWLLTTAGEQTCRCALRSSSDDKFPSDASAADAASISSAFCNNLKKNEDLVCELSRESDTAGHQLCGATLSAAHFYANAAGGYIKSIFDSGAAEEEYRDAVVTECTAQRRSILIVLVCEELMRQTPVADETNAYYSSNRLNCHAPPCLDFAAVDLMII
jgi:hypothetical protein